ncbi:Holliday junction branch migration protein RuvA [bacterium]|nr:Holliday junction branch migration protein RuvA [bacterium]
MISYLEGTVSHSEHDNITVLVNGVGYRVGIAQPHGYGTQQPIKIFIHTHWHQDNGPALFGFKLLEEKKLFESLISCSGIGPKMALGVLSEFAPAACIELVQAGDVKALSRVSGIGAKKAEHIIVQLRPKVAKLLDSGLAFAGDANLKNIRQLGQVLTSLNYSRQEILGATQYVQEEFRETQATFDILMRKALAYLAHKI